MSIHPSKLHHWHWAKLGERTRLMLERLNDCVILRASDLETLVWPHTVSRQARAERLALWQADQFLQAVPTSLGPCYQLGRTGARILRAAEFPRVAPTRPIADRSQPGLVLANQFGVALHRAIQHEPTSSGMAWTIAPFSGAVARGDGLAVLNYNLHGQHLPRERADAYAPWLAAENFHPPAGTAVQRLVVEIDSGTENQQQLDQRARQWRQRWDRTVWPPATHAVFLWITTGGAARLESIWRAWAHHALLPAFFTTVDRLTPQDSPQWQPWQNARTLGSPPVWRDMYGRPRSLCPWAGDEPAWRFEQPVPVVASSLHASVAAYQAEVQQ